MAYSTPAAPDMSNYIPAKRTGLPFWDIYFFGKIPLWRAYLEAADHFGMGLLPDHDFHQLHSVNRVEEVDANDALGILGGGSNLGDRER